MSGTDSLQPGTQLDGRYEVVRLLGQGGMAAVYEVRHLGLHSTHALKVLNADLARDDELRGRFLAEGRIQARLRHPNIVQVTEIVTSPVAGLVMDYVDGPTLADFCQQKGPLDLPTVLQVFLPVLDAVDEAHKAHVVHRDLKPDNIMLGRDNRGRLQPMVTDFGIAKMLLDEQETKRKTRAGARMGTLLYMSPEQVRGAGEVDARSDIFALGAILYEAVTGKIAFDGASEYDTMQSIVQGTYEPPERVVGNLPPILAGCIRKALAVDPAERFQDCAAFRAALETALDAQPQIPEKPSRSYAVTQVRAAPESAQPEGAQPAPAPAVAQSAPAAVVQPAQAPVAQPAPAAVVQSAPAPVAQPEPVGVAQSASASVAQPEPVGVAQSSSAFVAQPEPAAVVQSAPASVAQPAPAPVAQPAPAAVVQPAQAPVARPAPAPVAQPAPTPVSRPVPAPVSTPVSRPAPAASTPVSRPAPAPAPMPRPSPARPSAAVVTGTYAPTRPPVELNRAAAPLPNSAMVKAQEYARKRKNKRGSIPPDPRTSPALATLLGLFCVPGVGQFYNMQIFKGLLVLGLTGYIASTSSPDVALLSLGVTQLLCAVDANRIASKRQRGEPVGALELF
jgi:serine/threonine-protein kinase